jgi:hypothetical protein
MVHAAKAQSDCSHRSTFVSPTVVPIQGRGGSITPPGPPERPGNTTHQLHAMAPGLVGQTIERAGGYKEHAPRLCRRQDSRGGMWISPHR